MVGNIFRVKTAGTIYHRVLWLLFRLSTHKINTEGFESIRNEVHQVIAERQTSDLEEIESHTQSYLEVFSWSVC
jgi:hypothetical protein